MSSIERRGGERRPAPSKWFDGEVEMEAIHEDTAVGVREGRVHFHNGAHTHWHLHTGTQVLYFVAGEGMVEDRGGTVLECGAGDIVRVEAGSQHRHGAREGKDATHVAITLGESIWDDDPRFPAH